MRFFGTMRWLLLFGLICLCAYGSQPASWILARSAHFMVYSQAGLESARPALNWFERLRTFFEEDGLIGNKRNPGDRPPLRVIEFSSAREYNTFRLRPTADAYYIGTESADYIVMPGLGPKQLAIAAHEYTHSVLHGRGLHLPSWLNEGLAEFFSTVRITDSGCEVGGPFAAHLQTLRGRTWLPTAQVLLLEAGSPPLQSREGMSLFYAQSWALVNLLISSPLYAPRFRELTEAVNSGGKSAEALTRIYGKSLDAITGDMRTAVEESMPRRITLEAIAVPVFGVQESELSETQADEVLAGLLLAEGKLDRAEVLYKDLIRRSPEAPETYAALGTIALERGDTAGARAQWKQAIDRGISDANLCYRYASLADEAGVARDEVRLALDRAIALRPNFDDARYKLALLDNNARDFPGALSELHAMTSIAPERAYAYWTAVAYAHTELEQRDEAEKSAREAMKYAKTASERTAAAQLAYIARTDLTVQFETDANGNSRLVTTRVSHGATAWNPFVEPGDRLRRVEGTLREIRCGEGRLTGIVVDTSDGPLTLSVPDPQHVSVRNGPPEFSCGAQAAKAVKVEYAASDEGSKESGVLRGLELH